MLVWRLEKRILRDLIPNERNPRQLTKTQESQLKKSLEKYGLIDKPIVQKNYLIGGHQRVTVMLSMGVEECDCWVTDDDLSKEDIEELMIRLNRNQGEWDFDILANEFDVGTLLDLGFEEDELMDTKPDRKCKLKITIEFDDKDTLAESLEKINNLELNGKIKVKL